VLDNLSRYGSEINLNWLREHGKFEFFQQDIRNSVEVEKVIQGIKPDVIFHLAGQVAMTTSIADPKADFEINALGTLNVLESVRKHSPACTVVYSSTNKVYGDLDEFTYIEQEKRYVVEDAPNGFDEHVQLSFHSPYGCSKGAADQYMLDYARMFNLNTVVFRHSSMYGGRQFSTYDQGWIGWFCQQAILQKEGKLKEPFTISGNGKQVRDVLHAEDMISLYLAAIKNIKTIRGQAFNIGGGMPNSLSLLELFDILEKELDVKLNYTQLAWRQSDQKVFVADIAKYSKATGWAPKVDKYTGVKKMLNWVDEKK
jgi:CDP-paratose 2-epimerase